MRGGWRCEISEVSEETHAEGTLFRMFRLFRTLALTDEVMGRLPNVINAGFDETGRIPTNNGGKSDGRGKQEIQSG